MRPQAHLLTTGNIPQLFPLQEASELLPSILGTPTCLRETSSSNAPERRSPLPAQGRGLGSPWASLSLGGICLAQAGQGPGSLWVHQSWLCLCGGSFGGRVDFSA